MRIAHRLATYAFGASTLAVGVACGDPAPLPDDHAVDAVDAALTTPPVGAPDIRGTVTALHFPRMRVEAVPTDASGSPKAAVTMSSTTPILRRAGGRADSLLAVGAVVSVWFRGPVAESYPVQARARVVVLEDAGAR